MATEAPTQHQNSVPDASKDTAAGPGGEDSMNVDIPVAFPLNPQEFFSDDFKHAVESFSVGDLSPPLHSLVIARSTESVASVFKKLIDFKILSLPILDVTTNNYVAFIDMLDILAFLVERLELHEKQSWALMEDWMAQVQFQGSCLQVVQQSRRNPWYVIQGSESINRAMNVMSEFNIHRLAVSDSTNSFASILTQSQIVNWLADHLDQCGPLVDKTLEDFKLGYREVASVRDTCFVVEAFLKIYQSSVSGVAVLNEREEIIGSVSASDLKDIGFEAAMFQKLFVPIRLFLDSKQEGATVPRVAFATRNSSVRDVLLMMRTLRIHRVFITESQTDMRLIGVVTQNDILDLFSISKSLKHLEMTSLLDPYRHLTKKVELRRSEIQGNGLFAKELILRGEIIWKEDSEAVRNGSTILTFDEINSMPEEKREWWLHYAYQISDTEMEGPTDQESLDSDYGSYYNHNCDANTWFGTEDGDETDFVISARRDIQPGEEITYDYGTSESWHLKFKECRCTASDCRKVITTEDWKRPDLQKKYGRHFLSYLLNRMDALQN